MSDRHSTRQIRGLGRSEGTAYLRSSARMRLEVTGNYPRPRARLPAHCGSTAGDNETRRCNILMMHWLLFAILGPLSWAISTHIDKYLVDKYFHDSDTAVLIVFTAGVGGFPPPLLLVFLTPGVFLALFAIAPITGLRVFLLGAAVFFPRAPPTRAATA